MAEIDLSIGASGWDWSALGSGLTGALIGGLFALAATLLADRLAKKQARGARRAVVVGGVKALWAEMSVNFARYEERLADVIRGLGENEFLTLTWPVHSDYFSVYAANAGLIGELGDDKLAAEIIETVTAAKGLIDSLRLNLQMLQDLAALRANASGNDSPEHASRIEALEFALIAYGAGLKSIDARLVAGMGFIAPRVASLT